MQDKQHYANGQEVYRQDKNKRTYYYKNGKIKAEGPFEKDQMEGEWRFYRETGQLLQIGNFLNNEKYGEWTRFDKNDQLEYNELFVHDKVRKTK